MEILKKCNKCNNELSIALFTKNKNYKYGVASTCTECVRRIYWKKRPQNNTEDLLDEVWCPIPLFEYSYAASNKGRVKSLNREIIHRGRKCVLPEMIMKQHIVTGGYMGVRFTVNYKTKLFLVHTLIAKAFIPNKEKKGDVNHKDGNKQNNHTDNLEWMTRSENHLHAYRTGLKKPSFHTLLKGAAHRNAKKVVQKSRTGEIINEYGCVSDTEKYGFNPRLVSACCNNKRNHHKGYVWQFIIQ